MKHSVAFTFAFLLLNQLLGGAFLASTSINVFTPGALLLLCFLVLLHFARGDGIKGDIVAADFCVLAFLLVYVASTFHSDPLQDTDPKLIRVACLTILPYVLARVLLTEFYTISLFLRYYVGLLACVGVPLAALSLIVGSENVAWAYSANSRLSYADANPIVIGTAFAAASLICAGYGCLHKSRSSWFRVLLFSLALLNAYLMYLSGSRGPLVALIVGSTVLLLWLSISGKTAGRRSALLIASGVVLLGLLVPNSGDQVWSSANGVVDEWTSSMSVQERFVRYHSAIEMIDKSFWLGLGPSDTGTYPHNIILETFMETGFVGTLVLVSVFISIWVCAAQAGRKLHGTLYWQTVVVVTCVFTLLGVGRLFSYSLTMHKDVMVFGAILVNFAALASRHYRRDIRVTITKQPAY